MSGFALELLGYVASAFVVASLAMSSVLKLRILSMVGSTTFLVYGLLIGSIPVAITNGVIMVINVVFLYRLLSHEAEFDVVEVDAGSKFLERYLEHNASEIDAVWPGYRYQRHPDQLRLVVFRDMVPAGVFIASVEGTTARVQLDFAGRDYRDLKNARVLFGSGRGVLRDHGLERVVTRADTAVHRRFLERFGFTPVGDEYVLGIDGPTVGS
jgi:uncharacterized protein with PQ loop repeat